MMVIDLALIELDGPRRTPSPVVVDVPVILTAPLLATIGTTCQAPLLFVTA